jgi:peptide/nickel transport system substrate-binding protein
MTQLKKGEVDLLESVPSDQQRALAEGYPHVRLYRYPSRRIDFISWNLRRRPFDSAEVRRALGMAIDRRAVIETAWGGNATECNSPVPPVLWAHDSTIAPLPFDPAGARAALERLGWRDENGDGVLERDGRPFEFEIVTNHTSPLRVDICTLVQSYLSRIGVKVDVRTMEFGTFIERVLDGDYDACVLELRIHSKLDLTDQWHSSAAGRNGYNVSFYSNPEVDRLIEQARECLDPEEARKLWSRVQRIIYRDQPFTFIAYPDEVNALHDRFCNVNPSALGFLADLHQWRVEPHCE